MADLGPTKDQAGSDLGLRLMTYYCYHLSHGVEKTLHVLHLLIDEEKNGGRCYYIIDLMENNTTTAVN